MAGIELTMKREGSRLAPTAAMFEEDLRKIPEGREVFVSVRMARNPQFHKWFFSALAQIIKSGQYDGTVDELIAWLKIACGNVHKIDEDGKIYYVLDSWSFASMDELSFRDLVDRVKFVLAKRGINMDEIFDRADQDTTPNERGRAASLAQNNRERDGVDEFGDPLVATPNKPAASIETKFDETFVDRLTALVLGLSNRDDETAIKAFYEANSDEFAALVEIDRETVAALYASALRRARGDIDATEEVRFANELLNCLEKTQLEFPAKQLRR